MTSGFLKLSVLRGLPGALEATNKKNYLKILKRQRFTEKIKCTDGYDSLCLAS